MAVKKNITSQGYLGSTNSGASPSLSALAKRSAGSTSKAANITGRRQYEEGYPVTTTYYNPNLTAQGYPTSYSQGSQPSTSALSNRSSYYTPTSTSSYSGSSGSRRSGSSKSSSSGSYSSSYTDSTPQYGGDYDILTGEYIGPGSSSSSGSSFDATEAYRRLIDAYKNQQTGYDEYLRRMNETAQGAYDRGLSSLNEAFDKTMELLTGSYDTQKSTLADNLERAKNALLSTYNNSRSNVSTDAESSLKQAYISNMLNKRDIAQRLSAMGLNGGMTETTLAGLANNYGNNRNNIQTTLNRNLSELEGNYNNSLSDLEGNYGSELANALQAYNNAVANANAQKMQQRIALEDALAANQMNAYSNYQNMLENYNRNYYDLLRQAIADGADISY